MPVYASTPGFADQGRHPHALMLIVGGHVVLLAAVMTAKVELPTKIFDPPIVVQTIPIPKPPEPEPQPPTPATKAPVSIPVIPDPIVTIPHAKDPIVATVPDPLPSSDPIAGTSLVPQPPVYKPVPTIVRTGPAFITPDHLLRPPYPDDKRRLEEEGSLRLRLSIDERGRVVAVEPVGSVDRSFFDSARRHLLAKWKYKPATEDGRPIPSSTVITLRFELERA